MTAKSIIIGCCRTENYLCCHKTSKYCVDISTEVITTRTIYSFTSEFTFRHKHLSNLLLSFAT